MAQFLFLMPYTNLENESEEQLHPSVVKGSMMIRRAQCHWPVWATDGKKQHWSCAGRVCIGAGKFFGERGFCGKRVSDNGEGENKGKEPTGRDGF